MKLGKYHSFKLSCVGRRTLRTGLEHTHVDVLCTMCMYILDLIYTYYIYVYICLMFSSPVFFRPLTVYILMAWDTFHLLSS